jgi:hypothetical protein
LLSPFGTDNPPEPDFVAILDAESLADLERNRTWVEWKVMRQYLGIYNEALASMRDINYLIAIDTRYVGEAAGEARDEELVRLVFRFMNSYLRSALNAREVRTAYNVLNQYRLLVESMLRQGHDEVAYTGVQHLLYYGHVSFDLKLTFVTETVAYDVATILQCASEVASPRERDMLAEFLELDRPLRVRSQEKALLGVRKAQVKLAAYLLLHGNEAAARTIRDDMRDEPPERRQQIQEQLEKVESKDFWEITDRGRNFEYMPPSSAASSRGSSPGSTPIDAPADPGSTWWSAPARRRRTRAWLGAALSGGLGWSRRACRPTSMTAGPHMRADALHPGALGLEPWVALVLALVLVAINGFFVAAEFALVKLRSTQIEPLVKAGDRRAVVAARITERLDTYLSAIQLGITLASLALGWIGEPAFSFLVRPVFALVPGTTEIMVQTVSASAAFVVITALHIVLGEVAPKSLAIRRPDTTSLWVAIPLHVFSIVAYPAIWLLNHAALGVLRLVGIHDVGHEAGQSEEELRLLLASRRGLRLSAYKRQLLDHALELSHRTARQAMVPRADVAYVSVEQGIADAITLSRARGFTRLPSATATSIT